MMNNDLLAKMVKRKLFFNPILFLQLSLDVAKILGISMEWAGILNA